jgi:hypothetical protein
VFRHRADRLTATTLGRVRAALAAGDPAGEVAVTGWAAQQICLAYAIPDPAA